MIDTPSEVVKPCARGIEEAEDITLGRAIEEGEESDFVARDEVFQALEA